jgi:RNA polymerase sigma factor (sigma-70 family)
MAPRLSERLLRARPDDRLLQAESDERLVSLARGGHAPAFAAIVERYESELLGQARRMTRDGRAEDIVQQAFLNAFVALQSGGDVSHLRGWLHQILRNAVIKTRPPAEAPLDDDEGCSESLEDLVQRRATARAALTEMSALPERQRDALVSTALWGIPRAHVAQNMGLSEGAVRQLVHRARLTVRRAVAALVPYPLMRFMGSVQSGAGSATDVLTPAGIASGGGLLAKVGAVVASGLVATGIAVTQVRHHSHAGRPQHVAQRHAAVRPPSGTPGTVGGIVAPAAITVTDRVTVSTRQSHKDSSRESRGASRTQVRSRGGSSGNGAGRRDGQAGNGTTSDGGGGHRSGPGAGTSPSGSTGGSTNRGPRSFAGDSGAGKSGSGTSGSTGGPSGSGDGTSGSGSGTSGSGDGKSGSGDGSTTATLKSTPGSSGSTSGSGGGLSGDSSGSSDGSTATTPSSTGGPSAGNSASSHERSAGQGGSSGGQSAAPSAGSGSGQENSSGPRDLSGRVDSSST